MQFTPVPQLQFNYCHHITSQPNYSAHEGSLTLSAIAFLHELNMTKWLPTYLKLGTTWLTSLQFYLYCSAESIIDIDSLDRYWSQRLFLDQWRRKRTKRIIFRENKLHHSFVCHIKRWTQFQWEAELWMNMKFGQRKLNYARKTVWQ